MPYELSEHFLSDSLRPLPYNIRYDNSQLVVDCCDIADAVFEEPFFDQSIYRLLKQDPNISFTVPEVALTAFNAEKITHNPTGFIFHISRCGSTLISRMLASVGKFDVFSEPAILEKVLREICCTNETTNEKKILLLKNVIQALAYHKTDRQGSFIKFSARAIFDYPLIKQAFPTVPCIFVYREPLEVLVSLNKSFKDKLPPGLDKAGLLNETSHKISMMKPLEFWARVVANQCAAALEMCECPQTLLVNYNQLPEAVWTNITGFCNIELSAEDIEQMRKASTHSAKEPQKIFLDDRENKRKAATAEIGDFTEFFARPYYNRLESIRLKSSVDQ